METKKGIVKFFDGFKNFGFIKDEADENKQYFVHGPTGIKGYAEGNTIKEGDKVQFVEVKGEKGPKAEQVEKIA